MKSIFTASILVLFSVYVFGQNTISSVEYTRKNAEKSIVATHDGFAVATYDYQKKKTKHDVTYTFFDENFQVINTVESKEYRMATDYQSVCDKDYLHMAYTIGGAFVLYSVPVNGGEVIEQIAGGNFTLDFFQIIGDDAYMFSKSFTGSRCLFYKVNWKTGDQEELELKAPGLKAKITALSVCASKDGGMFVFGVNKNKEKGYDTQMFRFNSKGEQVSVTTFKNVLSRGHKVTEKLDGSLIISGTTSENVKKPTNGIFIGNSKGTVVLMQKQLSFSEIPGFLDYSPKEYKKGYKIGQIQMASTSAGFVFWGECFYVNNYKMNEKVYFDSYQFTHGFACFFDGNGNINSTESFNTDYKVEHRSNNIGLLNQKQIDENSVLVYSSELAYQLNGEDNSVNEVELGQVESEKDMYYNQFESEYDILRRNEGWDLGYIKNRNDKSKYTFFKIPHQVKHK